MDVDNTSFDEVELVRDDLTPKPLKVGDFWCLISARWIEKWKAYVRFSDTSKKRRLHDDNVENESMDVENSVNVATEDHPGEIDNRCLLPVSTDADSTSNYPFLLNPLLEEELDYYFLSPGIYRLLESRYGSAKIGTRPVSLIREVVSDGGGSGCIELHPMRINIYCSTIRRPKPHVTVSDTGNTAAVIDTGDTADASDTGVLASRHSSVRSLYDNLSCFIGRCGVTAASVASNIRVWYRLVDDSGFGLADNELSYEPSARNGRRMLSGVCDVETVPKFSSSSSCSEGGRRITWRLLKVSHDSLSLHQLCGDNLNVRADVLVEFGYSESAPAVTAAADTDVLVEDAEADAEDESGPFGFSTSVRKLFAACRRDSTGITANTSLMPALGVRYPRADITEAWKHSLCVGDEVEACDNSKAWYAAFVTRIDVDTGPSSSSGGNSVMQAATPFSYATAVSTKIHTLKSVRVHFRSWSDGFDRDISACDFRKLIRPLFTLTHNWRRQCTVEEATAAELDATSSCGTAAATATALRARRYCRGIAVGMHVEVKHRSKWFKGVILRFTRGSPNVVEGAGAGAGDDDCGVASTPTLLFVTVEITAMAGTVAVTVDMESDDLAPHPMHVKATVDGTSSAAVSTAVVPRTSVANSSTYRQSYSSYSDGSGHRRGKPPARGAVGLQNLGNTCFMNSMLQCLGNTECLSRYFSSGYYTKEINTDNPLGHNGAVARCYAELMKHYWDASSSYTVLSPVDFKRTIAEFAPQFQGYQQHDSQEFMQFVLDGLHEDLNRVAKKPYVEGVEGEGRPDLEVARESWSKHVLRNDSHILDCCFGLLKSHVTCTNCQHQSTTFDAYSSLSLPLPINPNKTIKVVMFPLLCHDAFAGAVSNSVLAFQCEVTVTPLMTVADVETLIKGYFEQFHSLTGTPVENLLQLFDRVISYNRRAVRTLNVRSGALRVSSTDDLNVAYSDTLCSPSLLLENDATPAGVGVSVELFSAYYHSTYKTTGRRCDGEALAVKEFASQCRGSAYADILLAYESIATPDTTTTSSASSRRSFSTAFATGDGVDLVDREIVTQVESLLVADMDNPASPSKMITPAPRTVSSGVTGVPSLQSLHSQLRTQQSPPHTPSPMPVPAEVQLSPLPEPSESMDISIAAAAVALPLVMAETDTGAVGDATAVDASSGAVALPLPLTLSGAQAVATAPEQTFQLEFVSFEYNHISPTVVSSTPANNFRVFPNAMAQRLSMPRFLSLLHLLEVLWLHSEQSVCVKASLQLEHTGTEDPSVTGCGVHLLSASSGSGSDSGQLYIYCDGEGRKFLLPFELWVCSTSYFLGKQCLTQHRGAAVDSSVDVVDLAVVLQGGDLTLGVCYPFSDWGDANATDMLARLDVLGYRLVCRQQTENKPQSALIVNTSVFVPSAAFIKSNVLAVPQIMRPVAVEKEAGEAADDASGTLSIYDCLGKYSEWEQLPDSETYYCSKCKQHCPPLKKLELYTTPDVLIVQFKRFHYSPGTYFVHREKINALVDFPIRGLDLRKYVQYDPTSALSGGGQTDSPFIYDLYGVSEHGGGLGGGHYTAQCLNFLNDKWYEFNDSMVTEVSATAASVDSQGVSDEDAAAARERDLRSHVVTPQAYVLFYKRRHGQLRWGGIDAEKTTAPAHDIIFSGGGGGGPVMDVTSDASDTGHGGGYCGSSSTGGTGGGGGADIFSSRPTGFGFDTNNAGVV